MAAEVVAQARTNSGFSKSERPHKLTGVRLERIWHCSIDSAHNRGTRIRIAAVRLAFVQEIPLEERELLTEIAREDADPRVRRAAVAKLMDPAALAAVAKDDADEHVQSQAVTMLRDIALEAFEGARRS